jgi:hypothetical protein
MKNNFLFIKIPLYLSLILLSCTTITKDETLRKYSFYLSKNKNKLEIIVDTCYGLKIVYANTETLRKLIKVDSLQETIADIESITFRNLNDYKAFDLKLNVQENKCVDFFLTRQYFPITDKKWDIKVIDKSPCF